MKKELKKYILVGVIFLIVICYYCNAVVKIISVTLLLLYVI